jgi:serine/threonine-protein kinase
MTDTSPYCTGCNRQLGPDDLYCSRCGTPTPLNVDAQVTVVEGAGPKAPGSLGGIGEVAAPGAEPAAAPPPSGTAFNAWFRQMLGAEYVAIKVIRPELVGTELFVESFRNEGVALAKLRHPGIVPIYDIRERGGMIYYVMPFVEGTSLEARMSRAKLPPYESRRILSELTDALAAAHRAKMVHLDIKPANVFLEGDLQKVLLMDFGIAVALTEQIDESSGVPVVGTPEYMSPEQARGLPEIDHRSDIYSIGALGYRMLMGRPPFSGKNAEEILEKHVKEAPVSIRDINPTIPKDFADAIMRCLEKDPWERFATAKELEAALQAVTFATTRTTRGGGETAPSVTSVGVERTTIAVIVVVALIVGLLIGLAIGG